MVCNIVKIKRKKERRINKRGKQYAMFTLDYKNMNMLSVISKDNHKIQREEAQARTRKVKECLLIRRTLNSLNLDKGL